MGDSLPVVMGIGIHGICLSYRHECVDLAPGYKGADGPPLTRMTFDWNGNEPRMMQCLDERIFSGIYKSAGAALFGTAAFLPTMGDIGLYSCERDYS
jgi:hypothetical protein